MFNRMIELAKTFDFLDNPDARYCIWEAIQFELAKREGYEDGQTVSPR